MKTWSITPSGSVRRIQGTEAEVSAWIDTIRAEYPTSQFGTYFTTIYERDGQVTVEVRIPRLPVEASSEATASE
jgi:hypothetical protein